MIRINRFWTRSVARLLAARSIGRHSFVLVAWGVIVALQPLSANAGIEFMDIFRNQASEQTGDGAVLTPIGTFFSTRLNSSFASEYNDVTLSYPGAGSPVSLSELNPPSTTYGYQSGLISKATLDADYPAGTYSYTATGAGGTDHASIDYSFSDSDYPATLPFLTGNDYSKLQGMNSESAFTFHFSPYDPGNSASEGLLFLEIFDVTEGKVVYSDGFLPPTTTELTLAGGTLTAGHSFTYELVYSNRTEIDSPDTTFATTAGFDLHTLGAFSSAAAPVPEPATLLMLTQGIVLGGWIIRRRRMKMKAS
jgi:hypothetical protein